MYFLVGNAIVDRDDLTLTEKMACVVLARYTGQDAFHDLLTLTVIAKKMSVPPNQAKEALEGLVSKGVIQRESADLITNEVREEPIVKEEVSKSAVPLVFESFDTPIGPDEILGIFDEVINKRQAIILFELAGRDLAALKTAYEAVRETHPFDLVEALSDYLQQKPHSKETPIEAAEVVDTSKAHKEREELKSEAVLLAQETEALFEALEKKPKTQVNLSRIHALYQQQKQLQQKTTKQT